MNVGKNGGGGKQASSRKGWMRGKGGPENASCTYKGVRQRTWGKWVSEIRQPNGGNRLWLGTYNSARDAALAYDAAARKLYGHNARLNLPAPAAHASRRRLLYMHNADRHHQPPFHAIQYNTHVCNHRDKNINYGGDAGKSETSAGNLNANLPEFDDSPMWAEAAATMDYHSQVIGDPGIAASTFDDAVGIELNHPLML